MHIQWAVDSGSGGTATNGKVRVYVNGALRSTSDSAEPVEYRLHQLAGNLYRQLLANRDWSGHVYAFFESMYVDGSWARVGSWQQLRSTPTARSEKFRFPPPGLMGRSASRSIEARLPDLSPLYLFVDR